MRHGLPSSSNMGTPETLRGRPVVRLPVTASSGAVYLVFPSRATPAPQETENAGLFTVAT